MGDDFCRVEPISLDVGSRVGSYLTEVEMVGSLLTEVELEGSLLIELWFVDSFLIELVGSSKV